MKILHKHNQEGESYETLCGRMLVEDIRLRNDMLLATLEIEQEDLELNFGEDAVICKVCKERSPVKEDELLEVAV